ncbi:MAG: tetratricopeptide repeat protein [Anaerolineae bacterium]
MSANVEGMVREGINAFKAGRKDEARALLSKAVELDPYNEDGWLWLSGVVTSVDDQRTCLENVLAINPGNSRARSGLDFLIRQNPTAAPPAEGSPSADTPAPTDTSVSPSASSAPTETSVEWAEVDNDAFAATGWHEAAPAPADESYDDWVTGLQLSAPAAVAAVPDTDPFADMPPSTSSPFFEDDLSDMGDESGLFDDLDPFASTATAAYGADAIAFRPPPANADDGIAEAPETAATAKPAASAPAPNALSAAALGDIEIDEDEILLTEEEMSLFPDIPKEIKATRLPGTSERVPLLLKIAVFVLVPLNIVAAMLFFWQVL